MINKFLLILLLLTSKSFSKDFFGSNYSWLNGNTYLAKISSPSTFKKTSFFILMHNENNFKSGFGFDYLTNDQTTKIFNLNGLFSYELNVFEKISISPNFGFGLSKLNETNMFYQNTNFGSNVFFETKISYEVIQDFFVYSSLIYSHIWITNNFLNYWGKENNIDDTVFNLQGFGFGIFFKY